MASRTVFRALELLQSEGARALGRRGWNRLKRRTPDAVVRQARAPRRGVRRFSYRLQYGRAAPDPGRIITVDPEAVSYVLAPRFDDTLPRAGTYVRDGDWDRRVAPKPLVFVASYEDGFDDRSLVPYDDYLFYQSCVRHFKEGVPWADTEFYQWLLDNRDRNVSRYETRDTIQNRLAFLDDLYERIESTGYKTQAELGTSRYPVNEVLIDVGRDGRLILDNGRHRLTIAKVLGLEGVPVRVFVRHAKWQRLRHAVYTDGLEVLEGCPLVNSNHPDLGDVRVSAETTAMEAKANAKREKN